MADEDKDRAAPSPADAGGFAWTQMGAGSREKADRFLDEQTRLVQKQSSIADLQIEELKREDKLRHWSLVVHHVGDVLKLSFELALALIFTAIVFIIGAAIWSAARDSGVVIEAFSVPPDLAARGLTGDVVATKVLDRLSAMQAETSSRRAASSYANDWGKNIKVQIPDTGVSIGELNNYLHQWLGNQTHITGEIYRTAAGIAVTARAGGDASPTFTGADADLDKLIQQAAEAVYRSTQPYRYAIWLMEHNRGAEATVVLRDLVRTGSAEERAWAYIGLGSQSQSTGDYGGGAAMMRQAIAQKPDLLLAYDNLASDESSFQHDEQDVEYTRQAIALAARGGGVGMNPADVVVANLLDKDSLALSLGDNLAALEIGHQVETMPDHNSWEGAYNDDLQACGSLHDAACMRRVWAALPPSKEPFVLLSRRANLQQADALMGRWQAATDAAPGLLAGLEAAGKLGTFFVARGEGPVLALGRAGLGDFKGAHDVIDKSPLDCVVCLRVRGRIDGLEKNWAGADYWFARAVASAPSIPFGYTDWGQMLLAKGDAGGAIAKFKQANEKGPHFADPLELWGEALMAQNRSDLALAKFAEAGKYAPNWGRLHLKWGEAFFYSGDKDGAKKQFAIASGLDLSPADKSELANAEARHG